MIFFGRGGADKDDGICFEKTNAVVVVCKIRKTTPTEKNKKILK